MISLIFHIPNAPGVNNLNRNVPGRGRVKTKAYKDWQYRAAWAMKLDGTTPRYWATITGSRSSWRSSRGTIAKTRTPGVQERARFIDPDEGVRRRQTGSEAHSLAVREAVR